VDRLKKEGVRGHVAGKEAEFYLDESEWVIESALTTWRADDKFEREHEKEHHPESASVVEEEEADYTAIFREGLRRRDKRNLEELGMEMTSMR
jgi:hypothetical protein